MESLNHDDDQTRYIIYKLRQFIISVFIYF